MKNIIKIVGIGVFIILNSCSDARDIDPVDLLNSDIAFQTIADLQQGLNGVYNVYDPEDVIQFSSRFTDDLRIGVDNGGQGLLDLNQQLEPGSGSTAIIWNGRYNTIGGINLILDAADGLQVDASEQADLNFILGQCYAIRALSHLDLMALYTPSFEPSSPSVPYITEFDVAGQPARNTFAEVAAAIKADLDLASTLIGANDDLTRPNQNMITAVRSRLALYEGDLASANTFSSQLIATFPLADQVQYFNMFRDTDDTEVIWRFSRVQTDPFPGGLFSFGARGPFLEVSQGLFDIIDPQDIRQRIVVDQESESDFPAELRVGKYFGIPGFPLLNDIKVFRVSEQYLIRAEVQARNGDLTGAATTIDQIRDARYGADQPTPAYANLEEAITDILFERRKELAFEAHRYIDLRRTRDITNQGIVRSESLGDCGGVTPCNLPVTDPRFTMPIPAAEIAANPIEQNPGY